MLILDREIAAWYILRLVKGYPPLVTGYFCYDVLTELHP